MFKFSTSVLCVLVVFVTFNAVAFGRKSCNPSTAKSSPRICKPLCKGLCEILPIPAFLCRPPCIALCEVIPLDASAEDIEAYVEKFGADITAKDVSGPQGTTTCSKTTTKAAPRSSPVILDDAGDCTEFPSWSFWGWTQLYVLCQGDSSQTCSVYVSVGAGSEHVTDQGGDDEPTMIRRQWGGLKVSVCNEYDIPVKVWTV